MWIKAKNGTLVNLDYVSHVHVQPAADSSSPTATVAIAHIDSGIQGADSVLFEDTAAKVQAQVDELFRVLTKRTVPQ